MAVKTSSKAKGNSLIGRIGPIASTKAKKQGTAPQKTSNIKTNPLALALHKASISTMTLSDRIRPVGEKASKKGVTNKNNTTQKVQKKAIVPGKKTNGVAPVSFAKYVQNVKKHNDQKQLKQTQSLKQKEKERLNNTVTNGKQKAVPTKTATNAAKTTVLTIKTSAEKKFLRIKNLEIGTSTVDLKKVLLKIGPLTEIRVKDLPSGSTTAEVEFASDKTLQSAAAKLNGAVADGRVIQVEISSTREIGR